MEVALGAVCLHVFVVDVAILVVGRSERDYHKCCQIDP